VLFGKIRRAGRGAGVVELAALEKRCAARYQGFESLPLRHRKARTIVRAFLLIKRLDLVTVPTATRHHKEVVDQSVNNSAYDNV
jgi:hypothetical protein